MPECFVDTDSSNCNKRTCALTFFQWNNHAYFTKSSRGWAQITAHDDDEEEDTQVVMERDCKAQDLTEWHWWQNQVRPGVSWTGESLTSLREEWLHEGVVPQACVTGLDKYSWIRRYCGEGKETCEVRQVSPFS